jgi:NAD+ synthase
MISDCDKLIGYICDELSTTVDIAVVGLSGGADSTLIATLCATALGKDNVYGISMPYDETDTTTFNAASTQLSETLAINHLLRPIHTVADTISGLIHIDAPTDVTPLNAGNSRSRARMCILYGLSHTLSTRFPDRRVRVMGTGNLSEDFIGYDTKGGDALADIFPIGQLFKSEVYQLLDHFRDKGVITEENINRTPSAGLQEDQTDEADLGYTYNEMEKGIRFCLDHYETMADHDLDDVTTFVWDRHIAHKHKHEAPPVIELRSFCD